MGLDIFHTATSRYNTYSTPYHAIAANKKESAEHDGVLVRRHDGVLVRASASQSVD